MYTWILRCKLFSAQKYLICFLYHLSVVVAFVVNTVLYKSCKDEGQRKKLNTRVKRSEAKDMSVIQSPPNVVLQNG